jgi:glycosyltransferase involved in cell wall biosynthesis
LLRHPCDVLFVPSGAVAPGHSVPCVPWVHDLAIYAHPEWFPQPFFRRMLTTRLYRQGVVRAPVVLAVSDATRQDIVARFGVPEARVRVTHEGGDPVLADLAGEALRHAKQRARHRLADRGITQPFVLQLGTLEPRKNVPTLLAAWREARPRFARPVDLVIAGADGWKLGPITRALDRERSYEGEDGARLHRVDAIDDDDRRDLLLAAELVAVPSFHEGFGLVALEAMQAGTAVMASDAGALPEVVGDAGILLPPTEVTVWARAMVDLMGTDEDRRRLAERGKARSQGMTWKRAAAVALHALTDVRH